MGPICLAAPALRVWGRTGLGQPSPLWGQGPVGTVAWTPRLLERLSLCTGSAGPGHQGSVPGLRQPPGRRLREPFPQLLPRLPCLCLPAWADSARLPARVSGSISQTLLHPEQCLQWWRLCFMLVGAEVRRASSVTPEALLRLQGVSRLRGPRPLLWMQGSLSQRRAPAHLGAAAKDEAGHLLFSLSQEHRY